MPPAVAALACLVFVAYLFWDDIRKRDEQSISWVPCVWMFLAGSRFASSWLNLGAPETSLQGWEDGSPIDRVVFFSLISWGAIVLARRKINWARLIAANKWIALYLLYCLSSLFWSDAPGILARRWIKDLGNPIVVLVMLTEAHPYEAVGITLRRLAFLLLPLSVVFIKYFPLMGRLYARDGAVMYTGVATHKNSLGMSCLVTGMYFAWKLLRPRSAGGVSAIRGDLSDLLLICMLAWLLYMANSQTSTACLAVAVGVLIVAKIPQLASRPSQVVGVIAAGALAYAVFQGTLDINHYLFAIVGRSETLTNRVEIWQAVKKLEGNPLVGSGFMSFWTLDRTAAVERLLGGENQIGRYVVQAHNGYLEQYLNLGYVGVAFIVGIMLSALLSVRRQLDQDPAPALLRLSFLAVAALYNYTEASFYGINNMWVILLTASITPPGAVAAAPVPARRFLGRWTRRNVSPRRPGEPLTGS